MAQVSIDEQEQRAAGDSLPRRTGDDAGQSTGCNPRVKAAQRLGHN